MTLDLSAISERARRASDKNKPRGLWRRFYAKFLPRPSTGCWIWTGSRSQGYGVIRQAHYGKARNAHRVSWELHCGPIPAGLFVCHKCDVRSCVNPDHLFLGTQRENMLDMHGKGRAARGEESHYSRITEEQVHQARAMLKDGMLQREVAEKIGLTQTSVSRIKRGESWGWLAERPRAALTGAPRT